jgi:hypothetical protein
MFCVYAIGACERHGVSFERHSRAAVELGLNAIRDSLLALAEEATERDLLFEGERLIDSIFYRARYTLVLSLTALLWTWCEHDSWPDVTLRTKVDTFLKNGAQHLYCWGEGAIPQVLSYYWYARRADSGAGVETILEALVRAVAQEQPDGSMHGLASPYFDYEAVARNALSPILGNAQDPLRRESLGVMSFFAEGLLHLFVRTGRKQTCRFLWPPLTKIEWMEFKPRRPWQFCLSKTDDGRNVQRERPVTVQWSNLTRAARSVACPGVPAPLRERTHLLLLWIILCPYRARPEVLRYLGWSLDDVWHLDAPVGRPKRSVGRHRRGRH